MNPNFFFFFMYLFVLYILVFKKDFAFAILQKKSEIILDNMREMYLVIDNHDNVIDCSESLCARFDIQKKEYKKNEILNIIREKSIIYTDFEEVKNETFYTKPYLYTLAKTVSLKGFKGEGSVILFYDETRMLSAINELNYLRKFDQMTDLLNRNHFEESRDYIERNYDELGVIIIDINNLKYFNDNLGHAFGDEVIIRVAGKLKTLNSLYENLEIYRMGGDEFMIIQKNPSSLTFKKLVSDTLDLNGLKVKRQKVEFAVGYSIKTKEKTLEKTITEADNKMYIVKRKNSSKFKK